MVTVPEQLAPVALRNQRLFYTLLFRAASETLLEIAADPRHLAVHGSVCSPFNALLHHLSTDLLQESFYALQRKASPGLDGVTWQEYESGLEDRLIDLHILRGIQSRACL
jgi:hypothetical protein